MFTTNCLRNQLPSLWMEGVHDLIRVDEVRVDSLVLAVLDRDWLLVVKEELQPLDPLTTIRRSSEADQLTCLTVSWSS